jgi:hypothetical protein
MLFLLLAAPALLAQTKPDLLAVDSAFVNGQYEQTEILALRVLTGGGNLTSDETARLNLTAGYAVIMLGREADARYYFAKALDAVPTLTLDPVAVSPKFRVVFDDVKSKHEDGPSIQGGRASGMKVMIDAQDGTVYPYRTSLVSRTQAELFNLVVPGSGQWLSGRRIWGASFFVLQAASAGYLIYQVGQAHDSREKYLDVTDPALIKSAYKRYDRDNKRAWAAGIATGVIYIAAQADLIWHAPHSRTALMLEPTGDNKLALVLCW